MPDCFLTVVERSDPARFGVAAASMPTSSKSVDYSSSQI